MGPTACSSSSEKAESTSSDQTARVGAPFLDIVPRVLSGGERGLLGLAFHPDYEDNGRLFVAYTRRPDGANVVAEYRVSEVPDQADPASERILLAVPDPAANHNGGALGFGPDGYLYIAMGDGGGQNDQFGNGQNLNSAAWEAPAHRRGRPLPPAAHTRIPPTNPFASGGGAPEIWAVGMRNPWRISFDREWGDLFIGDVGGGAWEEINRQPADAAGGLNYGWPIMEGRHCLTGTCTVTGYVQPIAEYDHSLGCSIIGGYVYRGTAQPDAGGRLPLRGLVQRPPVHPPGRRGHDHAQDRPPHRAAGELVRRGRLGRDLPRRLRRRRTGGLYLRGRAVGSEGPGGPQAHPSVMTDDQVVEELDVEQAPRVGQVGGDPQVVARRRGITGRVVMGDDDRRRLAPNGLAVDLTDAHRGPGQVADVDRRRGRGPRSACSGGTRAALRGRGGASRAPAARPRQRGSVPASRGGPARRRPPGELERSGHGRASPRTDLPRIGQLGHEHGGEPGQPVLVEQAPGRGQRRHDRPGRAPGARRRAPTTARPSSGGQPPTGLGSCRQRWQPGRLSRLSARLPPSEAQMPTRNSTASDRQLNVAWTPITSGRLRVAT